MINVFILPPSGLCYWNYSFTHFSANNVFQQQRRYFASVKHDPAAGFPAKKLTMHRGYATAYAYVCREWMGIIVTDAFARTNATPEKVISLFFFGRRKDTAQRATGKKWLRPLTNFFRILFLSFQRNLTAGNYLAPENQRVEVQFRIDSLNGESRNKNRHKNVLFG